MEMIELRLFVMAGLIVVGVLASLVGVGLSMLIERWRPRRHAAARVAAKPGKPLSESLRSA